MPDWLEDGPGLLYDKEMGEGAGKAPGMAGAASIGERGKRRRRRAWGLQVQEAAGVSLGGVLLPDSAKERPIAGTVVRTGPGKREKDGARKAPKVKAGDQILYFKWAGDVIEAPSGDSYVVLHEVDILAKV
eukprot:jgi/Botrbrau1/21027/Bobra.0144s0039.1